MVLDSRDKAVIAAIQGGLPLVSQPFKVTASALDMSEAELLDRISNPDGAGCHQTIWYCRPPPRTRLPR